MDRISAQLGTKFSLTVATKTTKVHADEYVLRQALDALFRGLYSGFGTTDFELTQKHGIAPAREEEFLFLLELKEPAPDDFTRASDLVRINVALKDASLRSFFDRGYTGDLTLVDFLIGVVLGERLSFHAQPPAVEIRFQTRHKRPTR